MGEADPCLAGEADSRFAGEAEVRLTGEAEPPLAGELPALLAGEARPGLVGEATLAEDVRTAFRLDADVFDRDARDPDLRFVPLPREARKVVSSSLQLRLASGSQVFSLDLYPLVVYKYKDIETIPTNKRQ